MIYMALPAWNEEPNIRSLLHEICLSAAESIPASDIEVVVVDDGSTDLTAAIVGDFAASCAAGEFAHSTITLLRHEENQGLAEAIKTGLTYCAGRAGQRDIVVTMDADNSHTPWLAPAMVRAVREGYDVVIASRYRRGARVVGLSLARRVLSRLGSWTFRVLFPIRNVRDYTCGYRAYRATLLREVLKENPGFISEHGFSVMVDILLKLRARTPEVIMTEVPLLLRYDRKRGASKMNVSRTIRETLLLIARRRFGLP